MVITSIEIKRIKNTETALKAIANITLDNSIAIHGIKVLEKHGELFLGMPSKKLPEGAFTPFLDLAHPVTVECRGMFKKLIFAAYKDALDGHMLQLNAALRSKYKKNNFFDITYSDFISSNIFSVAKHEKNDVIPYKDDVA